MKYSIRGRQAETMACVVVKAITEGLRKQGHRIRGMQVTAVSTCGASL